MGTPLATSALLSTAGVAATDKAAAAFPSGTPPVSTSSMAMSPTSAMASETTTASVASGLPAGGLLASIASVRTAAKTTVPSAAAAEVRSLAVEGEGPEEDGCVGRTAWHPYSKKARGKHKLKYSCVFDHGMRIVPHRSKLDKLLAGYGERTALAPFSTPSALLCPPPYPGPMQTELGTPRAAPCASTHQLKKIGRELGGG